jgi:GDP/UDP-N,N'-diacetylbacillosamine 2-epimerase (hydrolysing)
MRKICYISGTRADFGLMKNVLQAINLDNELDLSVIVTGMHLLKKYGNTYSEISEAGLKISGKVNVHLSGASGYEMSIALGEQVIGFTKILANERPDIVILLGDRSEMLAGAIASLHLNIVIAHIHGGELSGTVDEPVRHAISKLSHYHFTSTKKSSDRLIQMGEKVENIYTTGAPGIDDIMSTELIPRNTLLNKYGLDSNHDYILLLFHPSTEDSEIQEREIRTVIDSILLDKSQVLVLMPNSDKGGVSISSVIKEYENQGRIKSVIHATRVDFLSLVAEAEVLSGNSSSGIIEAASLGTPVLNIGFRQRNRERNNNVIDVKVNSSEIISGLAKAKSMKGQSWKNVYGDGSTSTRILPLLKSLSLNTKILEKINAY